MKVTTIVPLAFLTFWNIMPALSCTTNADCSQEYNNGCGSSIIAGGKITLICVFFSFFH